MTDLKHLNIQYITNEKGKKTAVVIPIDSFEQLLEDINDLAVIAERKDESTIPHEEVVAELKDSGVI